MGSGQWLARLRDERGMALLLSILILVAAAVVALSVGLDTTLETRIAGNQKTTAMAFLNAEAGLQQARVLLAREFAAARSNLVKMGQNKQPDWSFLFTGGATSVAVNLGSADYQVSAINPGYSTSGVPVITVKSIGFGRGGARQIVEEKIQAFATGAQSGNYAQQGGGSTKANSNARDMDTVSNSQISSGTLK